MNSLMVHGLVDLWTRFGLVAQSPLGELEALAGLLVAVLLAFDHSGVAGEVPAVAEAGFEVGADSLRAGPGRALRHGLTVLAAPIDVDKHVDPAAHLGALRGARTSSLDFEREIGVDVQVVDDELAGPFTDADAGDGRLPPAGAPGIRFCAVAAMTCRSFGDVPSSAGRRGLGFGSYLDRFRCQP